MYDAILLQSADRLPYKVNINYVSREASFLLEKTAKFKPVK